MSSEDTIPSTVPILNGSNYHPWECAMKAFLQTKGLFKYLRATFTEPRAATAAEIASMAATGTTAATISTVQSIIDACEQYEEDTNKIISYFILKMTSSLQQLHARATNAKTLWDSLAMAYAMTGSVAIFNDFTEVTEWRFDDRKDLTISMSELQARLERLTSQGITLPENVKAMILLKAVPKNWDNFAAVILATTTASALNITAVLLLIQEEWRRQNPHPAANLSQQQLPQGAQQGQWQTVCNTFKTFRGFVCVHPMRDALNQLV